MKLEELVVFATEMKNKNRYKGRIKNLRKETLISRLVSQGCDKQSKVKEINTLDEMKEELEDNMNLNIVVHNNIADCEIDNIGTKNTIFVKFKTFIKDFLMIKHRTYEMQKRNISAKERKNDLLDLKFLYDFMSTKGRWMEDPEYGNKIEEYEYEKITWLQVIKETQNIYFVNPDTFTNNTKLKGETFDLINEFNEFIEENYDKKGIIVNDEFYFSMMPEKFKSRAYKEIENEIEEENTRIYEGTSEARFAFWNQGRIEVSTEKIDNNTDVIARCLIDRQQGCKTTLMICNSFDEIDTLSRRFAKIIKQEMVSISDIKMLSSDCDKERKSLAEEIISESGKAYYPNVLIIDDGVVDLLLGKKEFVNIITSVTTNLRKFCNRVLLSSMNLKLIGRNYTSDDMFIEEETINENVDINEKIEESFMSQKPWDYDYMRSHSYEFDDYNREDQINILERVNKTHHKWAKRVFKGDIEAYVIDKFYIRKLIEECYKYPYEPTNEKTISERYEELYNKLNKKYSEAYKIMLHWKEKKEELCCYDVEM